MSNLPQPATAVEMYLAAILKELQALGRAVGADPGEPREDGGEIELKEPAKTKKK